MKRLLKRRFAMMWTLLLSAGSVYTLVLVFRWQNYDPLRPNEFDNRLIATMGIVYLATAITMLLHNETWPLRAHGQWLTYVGDALFWGGLGFYRLGLRHPFTVDDLTKIRAVFVVAVLCLGLAVVFLNVGAGIDRWHRWREDRKTTTVMTDDQVITHIPVERRSGVERRRNWRPKEWGKG